MTTLELARIAERIVPPVGATGWRLTVITTRPATVYAVVPVLFGRVDGRPVFSGNQADCNRMYDLITGAAAPRRVQVSAIADSAGSVRGPWLTEAPEQLGAPAPLTTGQRLCVGCGAPLPADARPNQRTHDGACRTRAARLRAAKEGRRAARRTDVTVSDEEKRSDAGTPATRSALEADPVGNNGHESPALDPRGLSGSPEAAPSTPSSLASQPRPLASPAVDEGGEQLAMPFAAASP